MDKILSPPVAVGEWGTPIQPADSLQTPVQPFVQRDRLTDTPRYGIIGRSRPHIMHYFFFSIRPRNCAERIVPVSLLTVEVRLGSRQCRAVHSYFIGRPNYACSLTTACVCIIIIFIFIHRMVAKQPLKSNEFTIEVHAAAGLRFWFTTVTCTRCPGTALLHASPYRPRAYSMRVEIHAMIYERSFISGSVNEDQLRLKKQK